MRWCTSIAPSKDVTGLAPSPAVARLGTGDPGVLRRGACRFRLPTLRGLSRGSALPSHQPRFPLSLAIDLLDTGSLRAASRVRFPHRVILDPAFLGRPRTTARGGQGRLDGALLRRPRMTLRSGHGGRRRGLRRRRTPRHRDRRDPTRRRLRPCAPRRRVGRTNVPIPRSSAVRARRRAAAKAAWTARCSAVTRCAAAMAAAGAASAAAELPAIIRPDPSWAPALANGSRVPRPSAHDGARRPRPPGRALLRRPRMTLRSGHGGRRRGLRRRRTPRHHTTRPVVGSRPWPTFRSRVPRPSAHDGARRPRPPGRRVAPPSAHDVAQRPWRPRRGANVAPRIRS